MLEVIDAWHFGSGYCFFVYLLAAEPMLGRQWYWQAVLLHSCHGVRLSWTAQAPQGDQQKRLPHISILGERGIAVLARLLFTFFPWCYNCIIKLSSQVQCRYCWWIVVACGSRDGKICCAVCSLGTLRQVITPPRLLPLIHKPYKDVVSEGGGKNFNVHSNIVTVGRES